MTFAEVKDSPSYRPLILFPNSPADRQRIAELRTNPALIVSDTLASQVAELIKINNPLEKFSAEVLRDRVDAFFAENEKDTFGIWVYYPWRNTLVRTLDEKDFVHLRTSRNKYKITQEEQDILQSKKIGVIGLSVGQSVALGLAMERSFGELRIADFDTLELSNMNRIRTGIYNLGVKKA